MMSRKNQYSNIEHQNENSRSSLFKEITVKIEFDPDHESRRLSRSEAISETQKLSSEESPMIASAPESYSLTLFESDPSLPPKPPDEIPLKIEYDSNYDDYSKHLSMLDSTFPSEAALESHSQMHQNPCEKQYKCNLCDQTFKHKGFLQRHKKAQCTKKVFRCSKCDKKFANIALLIEHKFTPGVHKTYKCEHCPYVSDGKNNLQYHMLKHSEGNQNKCDICDKILKNKYILKKHKIRLHSKESPDKNLSKENIVHEKKFQCSICDKKFAFLGGLERHNLLKHLENGLYCQYKCDICDESFKGKQHLKLHQKSHGVIEILRCIICKKKFLNKSLLEEHMATPDIHTAFRCNNCPYYSYRKKNLRKHVEIHEEIKRYKCNVCDKDFNQKQKLSSHQVIHFDKKMLRCNVCKRVFQNVPSLERHKARPHIVLRCEHCPYISFRKTYLASHMAMHSETAYKCDNCRESCKSKRELKIHRENCHQVSYIQDVVSTHEFPERVYDHLA